VRPFAADRADADEGAGRDLVRVAAAVRLVREEDGALREQPVVVAPADEQDVAFGRGRATVAAPRERDERERYGQVAALAPPLVTFVEMTSHHVPPLPIRWNTWSYFVLERLYVCAS